MAPMSVAASLPGPRTPGLYNMLFFGLRPIEFARSHVQRFGLTWRMKGMPATVVFTARPEHARQVFSADPKTFQAFNPEPIVNLFGPNAVIAGLDIQPLDAPAEAEGFLIEIADQQDEAALRRIVERLGGVDIVIDDGSHFASHQARSFEVLYPLVAAEGLYVCEDLHAAYWPDYEGGLRRPGTFIEFTKGMIDALHGWYLPQGSIDDPHRLKETCYGLHVYDSMVVVEKRPKTAPYDILTGAPGRS